MTAIDKDKRQEFGRFLEQLAGGTFDKTAWSTFAVQHYRDQFLEAIRCECVRISIRHRQVGEGIPYTPNAKQEFRNLLKCLSDGTSEEAGIALVIELQGRSTVGATAADAKAAVDDLDGAQNSIATLTLGSGRRLTVAGGPDRYVLELEEELNHRLCAIDRHSTEERVTLVIAGQQADYPGELCLGRDTAIEVVRAFVETNGGRSKQVEWSIRT